MHNGHRSVDRVAKYPMQTVHKAVQGLDGQRDLGSGPDLIQ
jgi:hypothetical protein